MKWYQWTMLGLAVAAVYLAYQQVRLLRERG